MSKLAALFPGQGSQFVGMAQDLYQTNAEVKKWFDRSNEILGIRLKELMFEGPLEDLTKTEYTQPAIFLHSVSAYFASGVKPDMVAGHSLGEFSALVAAGVLSFEDGLQVVRLRGQHMQTAGEVNPGAMAAVIGMDDVKVEAICERVTSTLHKTVVAANFNCPGQLVISGDVEAVEQAMAQLKEEGCRLVKRLVVSGAFHSPLMHSAFEPLAKALQAITFTPARVPVYANYTALPTTDPIEIKENLLNQLLNPVRWTQSLLNMHKDGANSFVEVGPGSVLKGLVQRTLPDVTVNTIS
jgi:[acyl-carrier-protein] S-malonyltransferase